MRNSDSVKNNDKTNKPNVMNGIEHVSVLPVVIILIFYPFIIRDLGRMHALSVHLLIYLKYFFFRLLADFQSRKAHRVHVRDKDLLKYLLCIVVVVTGYMAAWTAVNIDQVTYITSIQSGYMAAWTAVNIAQVTYITSIQSGYMAAWTVVNIDQVTCKTSLQSGYMAAWTAVNIDQVMYITSIQL